MTTTVSICVLCREETNPKPGSNSNVGASNSSRYQSHGQTSGQRLYNSFCELIEQDAEIGKHATDIRVQPIECFASCGSSCNVSVVGRGKAGLFGSYLRSDSDADILLDLVRDYDASATPEINDGRIIDGKINDGKINDGKINDGKINDEGRVNDAEKSRNCVPAHISLREIGRMSRTPRTSRTSRRSDRARSESKSTAKQGAP